MPVALFGITNSGLNLFVNLLLLFLIVVWISLIAWTYLDARRRIRDPVLVGCATAASLFPYVGTIVYAILRPPEYLEDARERELEIRASELRVRQLEEGSCPNCEFPIERSYLRCPNCRVRVKDPCESCGKPIDPRWTLCPYCETPVRKAAPRRTGEPGARPAERPSRPRPAPERAARASGDRAARNADRSSRSADRAARPAPDRAVASRAPSRASASRPAAKERQSSRAPSGGSGRSSRRDASGGRPAPAPE